MRKNPYLQLIRPANLITSGTNIVAGSTIAYLLASPLLTDGFAITRFLYLVISSILLYAGGIALNDVLDAELDRTERPQRPIPSGRISICRATIYALSLSVAGVILAFMNHGVSGLLATGIVLFSYIYNKEAKHHAFAGPAVMGFLRALNLLLGLSILPGLVVSNYIIGLFPMIYIFAVTMVSQGEVHGGSQKTLFKALALYIFVDIGILAFGWSGRQNFLPFIFVFLHLLFILPPLLKAAARPTGPLIGEAVKYGILGMILMDALWVSLSPFSVWAFLVLLLLPLSQKLARYFAVT